MLFVGDSNVTVEKPIMILAVPAANARCTNRISNLLQLFAVESADANHQTRLNQNQIAKNQFSCFQRITKDSHPKNNHTGAQMT